VWKRWGLPRFTQVPFLGGVRLRLSAGGATSAGGVRVSPLPGHVPFGSSLSASLACCLLRRLNSGSPELAIPSNPSSRPPGEAGSRSVPSRFSCRPKRTEATLSRELRTPGLPPTHVPVRCRWQNTGSSLINTRATSCRTPSRDIQALIWERLLPGPKAQHSCRSRLVRLSVRKPPNQLKLLLPRPEQQGIGWLRAGIGWKRTQGRETFKRGRQESARFRSDQAKSVGNGSSITVAFREKGFYSPYTHLLNTAS
jgi:hypothetical protein